MSAVVELVCRAEDVVVAEVVTDGMLDAAAIVSGLRVRNRLRCPGAQKIEDGVQLTCGRCHEPLFFRGADNNLIPANPGNFRVEN